MDTNDGVCVSFIEQIGDMFIERHTWKRNKSMCGSSCLTQWMYRDLLFTHRRSPAGNGAEVGATLQTAIWCLTTETENYFNQIQNEHIVNTVFQETRLFFFLKTQAELSYTRQEPDWCVNHSKELFAVSLWHCSNVICSGNAAIQDNTLRWLGDTVTCAHLTNFSFDQAQQQMKMSSPDAPCIDQPGHLISFGAGGIMGSQIQQEFSLQTRIRHCVLWTRTTRWWQQT